MTMWLLYVLSHVKPLVKNFARIDGQGHLPLGQCTRKSQSQYPGPIFQNMTLLY